MENFQFEFNHDGFNKLFPFYILIDNNFNIKSCGESMFKIIPNLKEKRPFSDFFFIKRPYCERPNLNNFPELLSQLIIIESLQDHPILIRGQFQQYKDFFLFVGSPWFVSMDDVKTRNLKLKDFSIHDPLVDFLHLLKAQEISNEDLKESVFKINEQKKILIKDREEIKKLSLVASAYKNGVILMNLDGKLFWTNEAFLELTLYTKEDVLGKTLLDFGVSDLTNKDHIQTMISSFKEGKTFDCEVYHKKKSGESFWVRMKGQPILDEKEQFIQYFVVIEDISKEKEINDKLKESENRLSSLIVNLQAGILLEDENRKILLVNNKFCNMFGINMEPEAIVGFDCTNSANDVKTLFKDQDYFVKRIDEILINKEIVLHEELELSDGRFYDRRYIPITIDGKFRGNLWSYDDVTLSKNYRESLSYEKEKYRRIINNMNIGLIEVDNNDEILLANQRFSEMTGYSIDYLIGKKGSDVFLDEEQKVKLKKKTSKRKEGKSDSYEMVIKNSDQQERQWLVSGAPNYNINGEVIGSIGIHLDITEQKKQEQQLFLLSLIAEKNINAVVVCDAKGQIEWVNNSFLKMSEYSLDEIIEKKPGIFLQGEETNQETVTYLKEKINKGLPFNCELVNYSKTGRKYWVSIQGQALYDKKGKILKYFAIEEDITNKKLMENQREELLVSLEKSNQELEDYALITSHDLKSPLRSIHSLITWIKEDNDKEFNEQTLKYLSLIENKVEKMDTLIEGILIYAKINKLDVFSEKVNLNQVVKSIIDIIYLPENIKIQINKKLPIVNGDRFRMQQLFQNIISNAVNYNDKIQGIVEIDYEEKKDCFIFSIKDNGPGIAKEYQSKIFEIFQSYTSDNNKSTGLGLSIVKKIIEIYKGKVWLESELGLGTIFYIELKK
jgi:PAS domain S-box-containing protein